MTVSSLAFAICVSSRFPSSISVSARSTRARNAIAYEHLRDHATLFQPSALYAYQKLVAAFELKTGSLAEAEQLAGAALLAKAERISLLAALHHTADVVLVIGCAMLAASVAMAVTGKGRPLSQPAPAVSHVPAQREVSEAKPHTFVVR
ncbi:hypothetical protein [Alicyclobacillus mali (ex Roth et al. 2021)]|uniref:hypothetical protein n=1 Tax=Alicyclobacillus mali (ex Roth et al. 2021) TaxID=1123961 RepID=UPI001A8CA21D|nr:hypothetical protein [Alicyclobacillus mali (ex Roth et al. 2021)]